jgi:hypothetical protein
VLLCTALEAARRLTQDGTWQDCAETTEVEALRFTADLLEMRQTLVRLQRTLD